MKSNLGNTLRKGRQGKQISLHSVADEHLSKSQISRFERGESEISCARLINILDKLNISLDEFLILHDSDRTNTESFAKLIQYIKFLKIEVTSYNDIIKLSSINGVKTVDFFQEYSLPQNNFSSTELQILLDSEYRDSDVTIGIIDGGISDKNPFLSPHIVAREEYVDKIYQNPQHATFIASTIQYGNVWINSFAIRYSSRTKV